MRRVDIFQEWMDIWRFVWKNRGKFALIFLAFAFAVSLGVWQGCSSIDADLKVLSGIERHNLIRFLCGRRGFFGYWLFRFLGAVSVIILIFLCGMRPFLSYLGILAIFVFAYFSAVTIGALFVLAALSVLPLALLCLFPFLIVMLFIFAFVYVHTVICALNRPCYYYFFDFCIEIKRPFLFAVLAVCAASLTEAIFVGIFSIGIVI